MTQKVFWDDPYQTELETCVSTVDGPNVTLKETIFYAFSGGQESDRGTIDGYPVLAATKDGAELRYTLTPDHTLEAGTPVQVQIDWPRRYRLMRLHFAAEVVLELFTQQLPNIEKVGAHIAEHKARIEFLWPENLNAVVPDIQAQAHQLIQSEQPIISAFSDRTQERRYWEVTGFARVPCGGTHLRNTQEVGTLRLKRKTAGKDKERIEIYVD